MLFIVAALSDYYDGRLARAHQQTSAAGGVFDHATDALFVSLCLAAAGQAELVSVWLAPLVVLAFVQYVLDSSVLQGRSLRANWLGRSNGIGYFVLTGFAIGVPLLLNLTGSNLTAPLQVVYLASIVLCLSTLSSMMIRAGYWWRYRQ